MTQSSMRFQILWAAVGTLQNVAVDQSAGAEQRRQARGDAGGKLRIATGARNTFCRAK